MRPGPAADQEPRVRVPGANDAPSFHRHQQKVPGQAGPGVLEGRLLGSGGAPLLHSRPLLHRGTFPVRHGQVHAEGAAASEPAVRGAPPSAVLLVGVGGGVQGGGGVCGVAAVQPARADRVRRRPQLPANLLQVQETVIVISL